MVYIKSFLRLLLLACLRDWNGIKQHHGVSLATFASLRRVIMRDGA